MSYSASPQLERYILDAAPPHYPAPDAPSSYVELRKYSHDLMTGRAIPVYDGGCEHTIYSEPRVNHAFRAWHDGIHIVHGCDFSAAGETMAHSVHMRMMGLRADEYGLLPTDFAMVTADVLGQTMYYERYKEYVKRQDLFSESCLAHGILETLSRRW